MRSTFTSERILHGPARGHRADGHVRRDDQRRLRVGTLEETITVTGESPIVDVQRTTAAARVRSAGDRRDSRPAAATSTGGAHPGLASLAAGARRACRRRRHEQPAEHARSRFTAAERATRVCSSTASGSATCSRRASSPTSCPTPARRRKSRSITRAISAEQPFGGLRINIVPREGGNTLHGASCSRPA